MRLTPVNTRTAGGQTPLHLASQSHNRETLELLLSHPEIDPGIVNNQVSNIVIDLSIVNNQVSIIFVDPSNVKIVIDPNSVKNLVGNIDPIIINNQVCSIVIESSIDNNQIVIDLSIVNNQVRLVSLS